MWFSVRDGRFMKCCLAAQLLFCICGNYTPNAHTDAAEPLRVFLFSWRLSFKKKWIKNKTFLYVDKYPEKTKNQQCLIESIWYFATRLLSPLFPAEERKPENTEVSRWFKLIYNKSNIAFVEHLHPCVSSECCSWYPDVLKLLQFEKMMLLV